MNSWKSLEKPASLLEGKPYFWIHNRGDHQFPNVQQVTFLAYTACPAVVVVRAGDQARVRCLREELLLVPVKPEGW